MTNDPIKRKEAAQRLLQHDLMVEARQKIRDGLTAAMWRRHRMSEPEQTRLDAMVAHYEAFYALLERVIADGTLREQELMAAEQEKRVLDRIKSKLRI